MWDAWREEERGDMTGIGNGRRFGWGTTGRTSVCSMSKRMSILNRATEIVVVFPFVVFLFFFLYLFSFFVVLTVKMMLNDGVDAGRYLVDGHSWVR
jgi:hypothetical protein